MLVAVHPWDIDGAKRAGLRAAWVNRSGLPYPETFRDPDLVAFDFLALAAGLTGEWAAGVLRAEGDGTA